MANTVEFNVNGKATLDASGVDKGVSEIEKDFNELPRKISESEKLTSDVFAEMTNTSIKEFSRISEELTKTFSDPTNASIENIQQLYKEISSFVNDVSNLQSANKEAGFLEGFKNFISDDTFNDWYSLLGNFLDKSEELEQQKIAGIKEAYTNLALDIGLMFNNVSNITENDIANIIDQFNNIDKSIGNVSGGVLEKFNNEAELALSTFRSLQNEIGINAKIESDALEKQKVQLAEKEKILENINEKYGHGGFMAHLKEESETFKTDTEEINKLNKEQEDYVNKITTGYEKGLEALIQKKQIEEENEKIMNQEILDWDKLLDDFEKSNEALNNMGSGLSNENKSFLENYFTLPNAEDNINNASQATIDYTKILEKLGSKLGLTNKETESFAKSLGASAGEAAVAGASIAAIIAVIKVVTDRMKEAEQALISFGEGALSAGVAGIDIFIDGIHNLVDALETAMDTMKDFADAGAEIQRAYYNVYTILGSEAGDKVVSFTEKLETLYGLDSAGLVGDMKSVVAAAGSLGVSTGDMEKATENMTLMANDLSIIAGDFKKASNDIGNAISKGFIGRDSSLYVIMTKQEKDELKSLNSEVERYNYLMNLSGRIRERYTDFLQTEAGQLYILDNKYKALQSNIQMLALSLYAKIAPILTKLIDLANIALTYIMKVFNLDIKGNANKGGESIAAGINKGISDVGKNAKKSGKEVDKLKKQVASFDDVIQINDTKSSDGDIADEIGKLSDVDLSGLYDLDDALENTKDEFEEFKKLLDMGMYDSAGFWLADWLADKLEAIPWDKIQEGAKKAADGLARFLNGFIRNKRVWEDLGTTLAEGLNTAVDFLLTFAKRFDFRELGDSLGVAWKAFWEGLDGQDFADMLYEWFMGVFELLGGFFDTNPLTTMSEKIVEIIHGFFDNFTEEDKDQMAHTLQSILTDVFNAALTLFSGLAEDTPKIIEFLKNLLDAAKDWFNNQGGKEAVKGIGDAILKILGDIQNSGLISDVGKFIREFINTLQLDKILYEATKISFDIWKEKLLIELQLGWEKVKAFFYTLFADTPENLGKLLEFLAMFALNMVSEKIKEKIETGLNVLNTLLFGKLTAIFKTLGIDLNTLVGGAWDLISKTTSEKLQGIINTVKGWITSIKETISNAFNNFNPFSGMSFNLPSLSGSIGNWFSGRHAKGGITNGASIGMIGEAGREAILPLENNTGWMDALAEKINGKQGDGSPVVIDISKATKPVYTRAEYLSLAEIFAESMKARGVAVTYNY